MGKVKISELTSANIEANDLIPFVKVPANNAPKSNKKASFADVKQAVLKDIVTLIDVPQKDINDNEEYGFSGTFNALIPIGGQQVSVESGFEATFDNDTEGMLVYEYFQQLYITGVVDALALEHQTTRGMLIVDYKIITQINNGIDEWIASEHGATEKFYDTSFNYQIKNFAKTIDTNVSFSLASNGSCIVKNKIIVTKIDYYTPGQSIPQGVQELLTIRVEDTNIENRKNTKIFKTW